MAQVRRMLARSNAARKEREDWNEALEELCVLRSQVSSTATVWHLPNRYARSELLHLCRRPSPAERVELRRSTRRKRDRMHPGGSGSVRTPMSKSTLPRSSRSCQRTQQPIRSLRRYADCGPPLAAALLATRCLVKAPIVAFSMMGVLTAGRRPSRVSCAFDRLPRLVNRLKSPRMLLRADGTFAAPGGEPHQADELD